MNRTALVIGATGLVGRQLVGQLLEHPGFSEVRCFSRRSLHMSHPNLREHVVDFNEPDNWSGLLAGDILFSCLGTTLKAAGSKKAQWKIDFDYQLNTAACAAANRVPVYVLVSAVGADAGSRVFYSRMKGKLEEAVQHLPFTRIRILRPSFLDGNRTESRPGEAIGLAVARFFRFVPGLRAYRPIRVETVARAMIRAALLDAEERVIVFSPDSLFELAGQSDSLG